jgi:hypothetical protein
MMRVMEGAKNEREFYRKIVSRAKLATSCRPFGPED